MSENFVNIKVNLSRFIENERFSAEAELRVNVNCAPVVWTLVRTTLYRYITGRVLTSSLTDATFIDVSAVRAKFCTQFCTTVKQ